MTNIYEIWKEIEEALEKYYECFDEDWILIEDSNFEEINKELIELQNKKSDFMEWILKKRVNITSSIPWIKSEIERLQKIVSWYEKDIDKTDSFIESLVKPIYDWKPLVYGNFKISFRKSESIVVDDENLIDTKFKKYIEPVEATYKVDKNLLKQFLKDWVEIEWIHIESKQNLQIK